MTQTSTSATGELSVDELAATTPPDRDRYADLVRL
jgi:hypothetical protein